MEEKGKRKEGGWYDQPEIVWRWWKWEIEIVELKQKWKEEVDYRKRSKRAIDLLQKRKEPDKLKYEIRWFDGGFFFLNIYWNTPTTTFTARYWLLMNHCYSFNLIFHSLPLHQLPSFTHFWSSFFLLSFPSPAPPLFPSLTLPPSLPSLTPAFTLQFRRDGRSVKGSHQ